MAPTKFLSFLAVSLVVLLGARPVCAQHVLDEWTEMSDGVRLYSAVTLPNASGGPFPTLLARTPYTNFGPNAHLVEDALGVLSLLGYASVLQETRGQGQSEGLATPFLTDGEDGRETLDWVLEQPWCDGNVMVVGASALAIPAYLMAPGADEGMACQALAISTPDVFDAAYHGGVFKQRDVTDWSNWIGASAIVAELSGNRDCDSFWDPVRVSGQGADVRAAAVHISGWYDLFVEGTIEGFHMYRQSDDEWAAEHQYLIIGPWDHFGFGDPAVGQFVYPSNASWDYTNALLNWLNWCMGPGSPIVDGWSPVQYYVTGDVDDPEAPGNEWREADDWPPLPFVETPLFLGGDGELFWDAPAEDLSYELLFDPHNPSPTRGGRNLSIATGPYDQSVIEARDDALVFSSAVLEEPVEAIGPLSVELFVRCDTGDADIAVRLTDVYPDGRSMLMVDGVQRLSRREGCLAAVENPVGETIDITIELGNVSHVFNVGHRIRVVVTASNFPRFELNPTAAVAADQAPVIFSLGGREGRPASLLLPIPYEEEPSPEVAEVVEAADVVEPMPDVVEAFEVVETDIRTETAAGLDTVAVPETATAQEVETQAEIGSWDEETQSEEGSGDRAALEGGHGGGGCSAGSQTSSGPLFFLLLVAGVACRFASVGLPCRCHARHLRHRLVWPSISHDDDHLVGPGSSSTGT